MNRCVSNFGELKMGSGLMLLALGSLMVGVGVELPAVSQEVPSANVLVAQSVSAPTVTAGDNGTFTLNVTNLGPSTATGVLVVNQLSSRSSYVSAVPSQGACSHTNGVVTCDLGELLAGDHASITLVARIGSGTNTTLANVSAAPTDPVPANNSVSRSIVGTMTLPQFSNSDFILLPLLDPGPGSVYPATILVSGVTSSVFKVTVTLRTVNHDYPEDIDVLLVGPNGQKTYLMSDVGLDNALVDVFITLDDEAAAALPDSDPPVITGTYRPSNYGVLADAFDFPAPPPPYATNLAIFRGSNPNGIWALYVVDDQPENATPNSIEGFIADGWSLSITTGDPISDLVITQSDQPDPVIVGNHLFYTLAVTNRGPAISTAVMNDVLPASMNFISAVATKGGCLENAGTVTCDLGTLEGGAGARITIEVAPTLGGMFTNRTTVAGNQLDLVLTNNSAVVVTTVLPVANLQLALVGAPGPLLLSQPVGYSLAVSNQGPNIATSVALTNVLPAGMSFQAATASQGSCTNVAGVVTCLLESILPGATVTLQITGASGFPGANSNYASVASAELDFIPTNNVANHLVTVVPAADLAVTAVSVQTEIPSSQNFVTSLAISNLGPSSADVRLIDTLPSGVAFVSANTARGACTNSGRLVQCDFAGMAAGEVAAVILTASPGALGAYTNVATVSGSVSELNQSNNSATNMAVVVPAADLALTLSDRPDPLWLGENLAYVLTVTNRGPHAATAVLMTNSLPPGVTYLSAIPTQGACARTGSEVVCGFGAMPVGTSASVVITIRPTFPGLVTNTAVCLAELVDPNAANNRVTEGTRVIASSGTYVSIPPVSIPSLGPALVYPSTIFVSGLTASVFRVRVTLTNLTHSYADDLDVLLVGPDGRATVLMSDAGGETPINNATLTFDDGAIGSLPNSTVIGSGLFRPTNHDPSPDFFALPAPPGPYQTNLALFTGTDPNGLWSLYIMDDADKDSGSLGGGWALTFSTLEPIANLVIGQSVPVSPAAVSSNLLFSYSITNRGPAVAVNARLTNSLPAQLQFISFSTTAGSCHLAGETLICSFGDLASGAGATVLVSGTVTIAGASSNFVAVASDLLDLHSTNNSFSTAYVFENPPVITLHPLSQLVSYHETAVLAGDAIGDPPLSFQWLRNGVAVPGATNAILTFASVVPGNSGSYQLRVSNRVASVLSDPAVLTVFGPPTISDIADRTIDEDTNTGLIPFTVVDLESPPETLNVLADSSDHGVVPPSGLALSGVGANLTLRVTPLPNQSGAVTIFIMAGDPDGGFTTNSFLLTVAPINDVPILSSLPDLATDEDVPLLMPFTAEDLETLPGALLYTVVSSNPELVSPDSVQFSGADTNRVATITPSLHQHGNATLTLTITDPEGATAVDIFLVTVSSVNDYPTLASLEQLTITEDSGPHTVNLANITSGAPNEPQNLTVTAHSSDPAIIPNPVVSYTNPASIGAITFAPLTNASGSVILTVTVKDGQTSNSTFTQSFTVDVTPTNDPPILASIPDQSADEDTPLSLPIAVGDPEGPVAELTLAAVSSDPLLIPASGFAFAGTGPNRRLTITPAENRSGTASITITLTDTNGASTSDTFELTVTSVNDSPTLDGIGDLTISEDAPPQTVLLTGISAGANEVEPLTFNVSSSDPALIADLVVNYTNLASTAVLTFRPVTNGAGSAVVTVRVDDGQPAHHETARAFRVTINGTNDGPSLTSIGDQFTNEDTPLTVPLIVGDAETASLSLLLSGTSTNGALVANTNLFFSGNDTNRTLTIVPSPNEFGTTLITVRVTDGSLTNTEAFLLTVNPVNDEPTLNPINNFLANAASGNPSHAINLSGITAGPDESPTPALRITASSSNPALLPNPTVIYTSPNSTGTLTLRPVNNTAGASVITVNVDDDGASNNVFSRTFMVNIKPSFNATPTISILGTQTLGEDHPSGAIPFTVRDAETAAGSLNLIARSSNQQLLPDANISLGGAGTNRTITLTPAPNQSGNLAVTLTVSDGAFAASNMTFSVTINPTNDVPTISSINDQIVNEDTSTATLTITVNDVETPPGRLTVFASSANETLVPNGNILVGGAGSDRGLVVTPAVGQTGASTITVRVTDGLATNSASFVLTVNATNQVPALTVIADVNTTEDGPGIAVPFTISDRETPAGSLTLTAASSNPALAPVANISFEGTGAERTVRVLPQPNQSGTALVTVTVTDAGGATASREFTLTVEAINDSPTLGSLSSILINENAGPQTIPLNGIGSGSPAEIQTLAVTANSANIELLANIAVNYSSPASEGTLTFLPIPNTNGIATISVTVNDGQSVNSLTTGILTVTINAAPTVADIPDQLTVEDTATTPISFTVADRDTPVEQLTVSGISGDPVLVPDANILVEGTGANRTVIVTPAANQFGVVRIGLSVADTNGAANATYFFLTIEPAVDPIVIVAAPQDVTAVAGATIGFQVVAESVLPLTYQWQHNEADIEGATGSSLSLTGVQDADAGSFRVLISNADTTVASAAARLELLTVVPSPAIVSIEQTGAAVNLTFTSVAGASYTLEYKNSLSDPDWIEAASLTGGSGVSILSDLQSAERARFYRVRVD
jgi:uncharacterized repeat protein (TIGR01451 family)